MKAVIHVVNRCLVLEFYRQNAAFFGLILLVFFGFVRSTEHIAIGSFLVSNPSALVYIYVLWLAYAFKAFLFLIPTFHKKENQFLEEFLLFPKRVKIIVILLAAFLLSFPVVAYATFLMILALSHGFLITLVWLLVALMVFITGIGGFLYYKLNKPPYEKTYTTIGLFGQWAKPCYLFFPMHLLRNEVVLLLLTKLYVCLMIVGSSMLYRTDQYDLRLLTTSVLLAFVGNVAIIHKFVWFEHFKMEYAKNLPRAFIHIWNRQNLALGIVMIPEFVVLLRHYPLPPELLDVVGIIIFGFGLVLLMYALMLVKQVELGDFMIAVFWLVVITTFLILFAVNPLALGACYASSAFIIIRNRYYRFEYLDE